MFCKRSLAVYIMLSALAAVLQVMPRFMGDAFVFAAVLGGFPIYTAARLNWTWGVVVYLTAAYITSLIGISEALIFICTIGITGLSLGIMKKCFKSIYFPPAISSLIVILMLSALNYLFEIRVFASSPPRTLLQQAIILFAPLYVCCLIYLRLAISGGRFLHKYIELDIY